MKAQTLAICIPNIGCDKNCPYCISKMTGYIESDWPLMMRNIDKVKTMAQAAQVNSVLFTGKGEPTLNLDQLEYLITAFKEFPVELQTNGILLGRNLDLIEDLQKIGLDILAVSLDGPGHIKMFAGLFERAKLSNLTTRVTLNIIKRVYGWESMIGLCKKYGIDQFSYRIITIPNYAVDTEESNKAQAWIKRNVRRDLEKVILADMRDRIMKNGHILRKLNYGATLYDYKGISVTWFDYCVQDSTNGNDIRSLIFQEDGHVYTAWNSYASKLF